MDRECGHPLQHPLGRLSLVLQSVDKPRQYAEASIPEYWIVDDDPVDEADGVVSMFRLELTDDGPRYRLQQRTHVRELIASGER